MTMMKALILALSLLSSPLFAFERGVVMPVQDRARVRAPEIQGGRGWLNTDKPLSLAALKGKIVLLDFWTYGCINCIHIIPDLKKLEAKYANQLVVIGVHSAKFQNEKETENIRRIILRYEIEHPVYNDSEFAVWQSYGVRAWPTQVLIDPAGYVVGAISGEGNYEVIEQAIGKLVDEFRKRGELNEQPLQLVLERAKVGDLPLAFPGKVLADAAADRLFIADSNHNRIVVTKLDGTLIETIGTGEAGATDGAFEKATFYRPQGLALAGDSLYVADTENHLIRRVYLKSRTVESIAGTGSKHASISRVDQAARSRSVRHGISHSPGTLSTSRWLVLIRFGNWISKKIQSRLSPAPVAKHVWTVQYSKPVLHSRREWQQLVKLCTLLIVSRTSFARLTLVLAMFRRWWAATFLNLATWTAKAITCGCNIRSGCSL